MPLTMDNSGAALVAGAPLPRKTRRVRVLRPFMLDGGHRAAIDEEIDIHATFAAEMVAAGKATYLPDPADAAAAEPTPKKPARPAKESAHARQ